jgi:hypothetical protein
VDVCGGTCAPSGIGLGGESPWKRLAKMAHLDVSAKQREEIP